MTPTISTTAWALHDLALATSFGGALFGRFALPAAATQASDPQERADIVSVAWRRFSVLNLASHGVLAATWLVGRHMVCESAMDSQTEALVAAKDALVAVAIISGVTSMGAGAAVDASSDEEGEEEEAPRSARIAHQASSIAGAVNLVALAGIVGITAVLAMKASRSTRWSLFSRWLP